MKKEILDVRGMHCASCAAVITKKLGKLDGVSKVEVNYAAEKAKIEYDPTKATLEHMNAEIGKLGYTLGSDESPEKDPHSEHGNGGMKPDKERELALLRDKAHFALPVSLCIFALMIWDIAARTFSSVPNVPLPMEAFTVISMIIATIVLFWIGRPFLDGVVRFVKHGAANMDTLIGIGTLTAYLYSVAITLVPPLRQAFSLPEYTYFDVTIVVIGFVVLGKYLEARSRMRTGEAIEKLLGLQAKTALVIRDGREIEIPVSEVALGELVVVKPGSKVPVDGEIVEGRSSIDESMVTGESIPTDKKPGDLVIGATLNKQGSFTFRATKVGSDTVLAQIIRMVADAQGSKAPIQALADKISSVFVPIVLGIATLSLVLWLSIGTSNLGFSTALSYGILSFVGVLVIACPCALGLATPTAIIVGVGKGAHYGILVKDAEALEKLSSVQTIVLDKTGTITKGKPEATDVLSFGPIGKDELLRFAGSAEKPSEHPLAQAIVDRAVAGKLQLVAAKDFEAIEGVGVRATVSDKQVIVRKPNESDRKDSRVTSFERDGKTAVIVEIDGKTAGVIALSDTLKDGVREALESLRKKGIETVMLTGDNRLAAEHIAKEAGIDTVIAQVLPHEKAEKVRELQSRGKVVAMAGDGINDAPALVQADIGIAMATGTDVAIESAGITLLHGDIRRLVQAVDLAKKTMRTVRQNLFWAFIYNVIGIPIAAGLFYPLWGIVLNPIFAGLAMAGSSVSVVGNSLRLKTKRLR